MASLNHFSLRSTPYFDPTCPTGSSWYACPSTAKSQFVGCCATDPCSNANGCSQGSIQAVSFNASDFGSSTFPPDASCPTASNFYTCVKPDNSSTFWGCCKSKPCEDSTQYTCPSDDLVPAFLGSPAQQNAYGTASASATTGVPTATGTGDPNAGSNQSNSHTGVIVGGAVAGGLGLTAIIALLVYCLYRRKKRSEKTPSLSQEPFAAAGVPAAEKYNYRGSALSDAPPTYSSPNPNTYGGYQQVAQAAPQELPAELAPNSPPANTQRFSELPVGGQTLRPMELETPEHSPRTSQGGFSPRSPVRYELGPGR